MSTFNRTAYPDVGSLCHGVVHLYGKIPLGSSGALATTYSAATDTPGVTVTKTATETGRYTLTLGFTPAKMLFGAATLLGADDTAVTNTSGSWFIFRDDDLATDGTIELQALRTTDAADAECDNSTSIYYHLVVKISSVNP